MGEEKATVKWIIDLFVSEMKTLLPSSFSSFYLLTEMFGLKWILDFALCCSGFMGVFHETQNSMNLCG